MEGRQINLQGRMRVDVVLISQLNENLLFGMLQSCLRKNIIQRNVVSLELS